VNEVDSLIKEKLVPLRKRVIDALAKKHPYILPMVNKVFQGQSNRVGLVVTEEGKKVGEYTFLLDGVNVVDVKTGVLESELRHPLGVLKPYTIVEKSVLEKFPQDEQAFIDEPIKTSEKYMPDITIKFLK
jgi:hypothetical protein